LKPEAFIFDIGNVLLRFDYGRAWESLRARGAMMPDPAAVEELARRYERGEVARTEFLARLAGLFSHSVSAAELTAAWQDIFEPNEPMWKTVAQLSDDYPLYLLSNTNCLQHDFIVERYPVFGRFRDGVFSYRAGMLKPEAGIFREAIRQFGVRPETTVYLDDLEPNVAAARAEGLRAFHYHPDRHAQCIGWLRGEGVQCV